MQVSRKIKSFFGINHKKILQEEVIKGEGREYYIEDYKIILKPSHVLDKYQQTYPLYDRFLPIICENLDGLIIDIGANIGDTSISIFSKNKKAHIVGVEPDDDFSNECISNINLNELSSRFFLIKKFVSTQSGKFVVEKNESESTGSMVEDLENNLDGKNTISFVELLVASCAEITQVISIWK